MPSHVRIINLTNGFRYKRGQVERAIENCSAEWVEQGVSIRNLNPIESTAARNARAKILEPMPYAEIPGVRFDPPVSGISATRREGALMWQAHDFLVNAGRAA